MKTEVSGEQNRTADSKELHCLNVPIRQKTNLCFAGCAAESVAAVCAREVGETVSRWLYLCTRPSNIERARLADIDVPAPLLDAGRDSVVATVDGAHADHGEVRRCVALAVLYCESRRPPPFECGLREGVDYFVERAEE